MTITVTFDLTNTLSLFYRFVDFIYLLVAIWLTW